VNSKGSEEDATLKGEQTLNENVKLTLILTTPTTKDRYPIENKTLAFKRRGKEKTL